MLIEKYPRSICAFLDSKPANIDLAKTYEKFTITQIPEILDFFRKNGVTHICLAGSVKKPKITLKMFTVKFAVLLFKLLKLKNKGDNTLLTTIMRYVSAKGFTMIGATELIPSILAEEGLLTQTGVTKSNKESIDFACKFLNDISKYDISQACIVQNHTITALEGIEGTAAMITRMKPYNDGAILVKMPKIGQTMKIDMPTIGIETIHQCASSGIKGIAIKAEATIILDKEQTIKEADKNGIFITSIV